MNYLNTNIGPSAADDRGVRLSVRAASASAYAPPPLPVPAGVIDVWLDANEGPGAALDWADVLALTSRAAHRYPSAAALEAQIAGCFGVDSSRVLATAGGDEAIDRVCRAVLEPGRELVLPVPTFEMIPRFARLAGAGVRTVPWPRGPYPIEEVLAALNDSISLIATVSPNNPTGAVAAARDLQRLSAAAPRAVLLVDLAYTEFADEDLTGAALALPNAVVIRTFSKALGLAGLRVGYAVGHSRLISAMRSVGGPFPVSSISLELAGRALRTPRAQTDRLVSQVRAERARLYELLAALGASPTPSQANFVLAEFGDAEWVWRGLASLGVAVRRFGSGHGLERCLRITCPGDEVTFSQLCRGLSACLQPRALLLDMDGVLADVSGSYRRAIIETAASFGVCVTSEDVAATKAAGDANNDWELTHRLVSEGGVIASREAVTTRFEEMYNGGSGAPGLESTERLIPSRAALEKLAARLPLAIVTGRPRRDCERFLSRFGIADLFPVRVCMEDGPAKPNPAVVRAALDRLGVESAWMLGDTPDDVRAARGAGVVPIGVAAPGDDSERARTVLTGVGAARVIKSLDALEGMLP